MIHCLLLTAEMAVFIPRPASLDQIILCEYSVLQRQPDEDLHLQRYHKLPKELVWEDPSSSQAEV